MFRISDTKGCILIFVSIVFDPAGVSGGGLLYFVFTTFHLWC